MGLIASGSRISRSGAPHTFVTTEMFLATFDVQSLSEFPELELWAAASSLTEHFT